MRECGVWFLNLNADFHLYCVTPHSYLTSLGFSFSVCETATTVPKASQVSSNQHLPVERPR